MTPVTKTFTFTLPEDLKAGLRAIKDRDGTPEAEQIRRAIGMWLEKHGVRSAKRRAETRRKA